MDQNEMGSTMKASTKYSFIAPGAIGRGRGRGLKPMCSFGVSGDDTGSFRTLFDKYAIGKVQGLGIRSDSTTYVGSETQKKKNSFILEKDYTQYDSSNLVKQYIQQLETGSIDKPMETGNGFPSIDEVMQYTQTIETSSTGKVRGRSLRSLCSFAKTPSVLEKEQTQIDAAHPPSTNQVETSAMEKRKWHGLVQNSTMYAGQEGVKKSKISTILEREPMETDATLPCFETSSIGKGRGQSLRDLCSSDKTPSVREKEQIQVDIAPPPSANQVETSSMGRGQGRPLRSMSSFAKNTSVLEKVITQSNTTLPPSTNQDDTGSCTTKKARKVRGTNKCKEVASLAEGEKFEVDFYNHRTVGRYGKRFSRHLGILVRNCNMCPLNVRSWDDISESKLNHLWNVVKDKFESDIMEIHREHVLEWCRELWNKWRSRLHVDYAKGKPIHEALKNVPDRVDKKQWEWLVKEHFAKEEYKARSYRNSKNRAKLKMLHHIGSKPIREIIYEKGGKDGNPPNMSTVFFETRKKNNILVEPESIEKHTQLQELEKSEPSLPCIEIVEKCFGPQNRSHVFGFGGGVKAKEMKGGVPSKSELREENQSLRNRLSILEAGMKELRQVVLAQHSNSNVDQPSKSPISQE